MSCKPLPTIVQSVKRPLSSAMKTTPEVVFLYYTVSRSESRYFFLRGQSWYNFCIQPIQEYTIYYYHYLVYANVCTHVCSYKYVCCDRDIHVYLYEGQHNFLYGSAHALSMSIKGDIQNKCDRIWFPMNVIHVCRANTLMIFSFILYHLSACIN